MKPWYETIRQPHDIPRQRFEFTFVPTWSKPYYNEERKIIKVDDDTFVLVLWANDKREAINEARELVGLHRRFVITEDKPATVEV